MLKSLVEEVLGLIRALEDYYKTSIFVQSIENRQGLKIA